MRVEIKTVTPLMAEVFLQANNSNRRINKGQLEMIKRSMLNGEWALTHQGVALYEDGTLADGQHRLTAIVETGVKCKMPIFYGIKKASKNITAIDCGKLRSVRDSAEINGVNLKPRDVALAKILEFGVNTKSKRISHTETISLCKKHKKSIDLSNNLMPQNKTGLVSAPVRSALVAANGLGCSKGLLKDIVSVIYSGVADNKDLMSVAALRNMILSQSAGGQTARVKIYNMVLNTCMAIKNKESDFVITGDEIWMK